MQNKQTILLMELFENEWRAYYLKFMFEVVRPRCKYFNSYKENTDLEVEYSRYVYRHPKDTSFLTEMSKNPNITLDFILKTHPVGYVWKIFGCREYHGYCKSYPYGENGDTWDWREISANPAITMYDVENHKCLPWDFERLCRNPNMTLRMFKKINDGDLDCRSILQNPFLGEKQRFIGCKMIPINVMVINEQLNDFSTYNPNKPWNNAQKVFAELLIVIMVTKY
jgi:hypothetical protein